MPDRWQLAEQVTEELGYYRVYFTSPGGARTDVTFFRGVPIVLGTMTWSDPYGDATAQMSFPQIGVMDDIGVGELEWLGDFSDVDIVLVKPDGTTETVWEGFLASYDWSYSTDATALSVQCQGALFQADRYVAYPQFPSTPVTYESLIADSFDPVKRPHMRTQKLRTEWPDNWGQLAFVDLVAGTSSGIVTDTATGTKTVSGNKGLSRGQSTYVTVGNEVGGRVTGFSTRVTGGWDKALTGFVSSLLEVMYTNEFADQWTVRKDAGRIPVLYVRQANREPNYAIEIGNPGISSFSVSKDYTQFANVIYGSGTSPEGSAYSRMAVSRDNTKTEYVPFAADPRVYPEDANPDFDPRVMKVETHVQFENGMYESDALNVSKLMLRRNQDPGYAGTMTLAADPEGGSRYGIRAGEVIKIRYFNGSGYQGINFHIAEVTLNVDSGTVDLKIDSKFRDLLTVEEVLARTRDPLTPIKMLQVGKQSVLIPDEMAPWSYALGSGFIPGTSTDFYSSIPANELFPFDNQAKRFPPSAYPQYYTACNAASTARRGRWSGSYPIRLAEKGDIRLTQIAAYDRNGNRLSIPFHCSIYYHSVTSDNMPYDGNGPSPFIEGAFQTTNKFGIPIEAGTPGATAMGDESIIIGWGDEDQPAGFSPGAKTLGTPATGILTDETSWSFDMTNNPDFNKNPAAGFRQPETAIWAYMIFYAEYHDWVYFTGRFFRKEPGT